MKRHAHRNLIFWLAIGLVAVVQLFLAPQIENVLAGGWTTPVSISSSQVTAWFPDIIADTTGRIHVVWAGGTTGFDTVLYTSSTDGKTWSPINDIAAVPQVGTDSAATRPAMWVDTNGNLNLSYVSTSLFYSQAPVVNAGSAATWLEPQKLNSGQVAYFSRLLQDVNGQIHLFYTENVATNVCAQCYHLFHRMSADDGKSWSDPKDVSNDGTGVAKPQIITDNKGNLFAVWESGTGGGLGQLSDPTIIKFSASYDGGKTWSNAQSPLPSTISEARDVAIGMNGQGRLVVVFLALPDNTVNYMVSTDLGRTWSNSARIDGISGSWDVYPSRLDDYSMAVDSSGTLHLALVGRQLTNETPEPTLRTLTQTPQVASLSLLHLALRGDTWSPPEVIASFTGDVPEWPKIAVSNGNVLNAVWFVRDQANIWNSDNAHYRIWYSRSEIGSPAVPTTIPKIQSTSTPSPVAIIDTPNVVTSGAAPDTLPTLAAYQKDPAQRPVYSESDFIGIFVKSLAPVVLVVIVIGLFYFIRHRR